MEDFMELKIVYSNGEYAWEIDNGTDSDTVDVDDISYILGNLIYADSNLRLVLLESIKYADDMIKSQMN